MEKKIRGGALIARALKEKGIDKVFTLSGGFCNPAIEGFMECQIEVTNCPHEQIAGHMADGYTRITWKPSVCLVGPEGFANAVPSMMEAWGERTPIIYITGSSSLKRQGSGGFKEIDDVSIAAPLTKYSASITDGNRIREFVADHSKWEFDQTIDSALNSTLSRTLNTSLTTLIVLISMFVFGGESIRGFMFALLVGVLVGTYSSVFIATPVMYDSLKINSQNK